MNKVRVLCYFIFIYKNKKTIIEHTGYKAFCDKTRTKHDMMKEKMDSHC